ncbi:MAG: DUF1330 domain-containing protein [Sterolibacteriaceae bacterium MAG5]|nr:DUF1330 domain-containing protein [Candidatus Nitricoxidireducens bremensis]
MSKPAYLVVDAKGSDPQKMAEYRRLAQIAVEKFGGSYLVRGGAYEVLEGSWRPERLVVVSFPDMAAAGAFYDSPEYIAAREARAGASDFDMLLVEAY